MALVPWGLTTTERFPASKDEGIPGPGSYDVQEVGAKKKGCGGAIALSLSCHLKKEQLDELRQGVDHSHLKRGVSLDGADSSSVANENGGGNSRRASLIQRPTRKAIAATTAAPLVRKESRLPALALAAKERQLADCERQRLVLHQEVCALKTEKERAAKRAKAAIDAIRGDKDRLDKKCRELERHLEVPGGTAALRTERDTLRQQLLEQRKALDSSEKVASELRKAAGQGEVALEDAAVRLADAVARAEAAETQVEELKGQVAALQLSLQDMQANTDELSAESSECWQRERARADELQQELNDLRALVTAAELDRKRLQEQSDQCSRENAALKQSLVESDKEMAQLHVSRAAETIAHAQTSSQLQDARAEAKRAAAAALQLEARQQAREAEAALARQLQELKIDAAAAEESHKLKLELEAAAREAERLSAANARLSAQLNSAESAAARLSAAAAADTAQLTDKLKGAREELEWAAAAHSEIADQLQDVKCKLQVEVEGRKRADGAARRVTLQLCACQVALKAAAAACAAAETATEAAMRDCVAFKSNNENLHEEKAQLASAAESLRLEQLQLVAANEGLRLERVRLASANEKLRAEAAKQQRSVEALHELVRVQEEVVAITKQDKSDLAHEHSKLLAKAEQLQLSHAAAVHKHEWLHLQVKAVKKDRERLRGEVAEARNQTADSAQLQQQCSRAEAALEVALELMREHEARHGCGLSAAAAEFAQGAAERAAAADAQAAEAREGHATLPLTVAELAQHWENKENRANAEKDLVAQQQRVASLRRELQEARAVAAAAMTSPMVDQLQSSATNNSSRRRATATARADSLQRQLVEHTKLAGELEAQLQLAGTEGSGGGEGGAAAQAQVEHCCRVAEGANAQLAAATAVQLRLQGAAGTATLSETSISASQQLNIEHGCSSSSSSAQASAAAVLSPRADANAACQNSNDSNGLPSKALQEERDRLLHENQLLARDMDMAKKVLLKAGLLQPHASASSATSSTSAAAKKKAFANALKPSNIVAPTISTIAKRTVKKSSKSTLESAHTYMPLESMLNAAALSMASDSTSPEAEGTKWSQKGALWTRQSTATNFSL